MQLLSILSVAFLASLTLAADDSAPQNKWGTYYKIEGTQFNNKESIFTLAFNQYTAQSDSKTSCKKSDASFSRWYINADDADKAILSYFCMTKGVMGYEHVKVSLSGKNVIEWQDKLSGFGITDAGDYSDAGNLAGEEAETIQAEKLALVNVTIIALEDDYGNKICVNPGTQTLYSVQRKVENGLNYYRFPISCDNTGPHSHMTHIEVAEGPDNYTELAVVEDPERNVEFIAAKDADIESGKLGGSAALCVSVLTLLLAPALSLLA